MSRRPRSRPPRGCERPAELLAELAASVVSLQRGATVAFAHRDRVVARAAHEFGAEVDRAASALDRELDDATATAGAYAHLALAAYGGAAVRLGAAAGLAVSLAHLASFPCSAPFRSEVLDALHDLDARATEIVTLATDALLARDTEAAALAMGLEQSLAHRAREAIAVAARGQAPDVAAIAVAGLRALRDAGDHGATIADETALLAGVTPPAPALR